MVDVNKLDVPSYPNVTIGIGLALQFVSVILFVVLYAKYYEAVFDGREVSNFTTIFAAANSLSLIGTALLCIGYFVMYSRDKEQGCSIQTGSNFSRIGIPVFIGFQFFIALMLNVAISKLSLVLDYVADRDAATVAAKKAEIQAIINSMKKYVGGILIGMMVLFVISWALILVAYYFFTGKGKAAVAKAKDLYQKAKTKYAESKAPAGYEQVDSIMLNSNFDNISIQPLRVSENAFPTSSKGFSRSRILQHLNDDM